MKPKDAIRSVLEYPRRRMAEEFLFWYRGDGGRNFGDLVGPYLYHKLTGRRPVFDVPKPGETRPCYVTVGSIMAYCGHNAVVWGAGIIQREDTFSQPRQLLAVRGPQTRARALQLGIDCPEVYGDPALLLPKFYRPAVQQRHAIGIIPHYCDYEDVHRIYSGCEGFHVINLLQPIEAVIEELLACQGTISSSLHGLIVSHAYDIPTAWVRFSDRIYGDGVKYLDHFEALGIDQAIETPVDLTQRPEIDRFGEILGETRQPAQIDVEPLWNACPLRGQSST